MLHTYLAHTLDIMKRLWRVLAILLIVLLIEREREREREREIDREREKRKGENVLSFVELLDAGPELGLFATVLSQAALNVRLRLGRRHCDGAGGREGRGRREEKRKGREQKRETDCVTPRKVSGGASGKRHWKGTESVVRVRNALSE